VAVPVGRQTTTVFGWVRQNAAAGSGGVKSAVYNCFVDFCSRRRVRLISSSSASIWEFSAASSWRWNILLPCRCDVTTGHVTSFVERPAASRCHLVMTSSVDVIIDWMPVMVACVLYTIRPTGIHLKSTDNDQHEKWRQSNLWSRYRLHAVGQHDVLREVGFGEILFLSFIWKQRIHRHDR